MAGFLGGCIQSERGFRTSTSDFPPPVSGALPPFKSQTRQRYLTIAPATATANCTVWTGGWGRFDFVGDSSGGGGGIGGGRLEGGGERTQDRVRRRQGSSVS